MRHERRTAPGRRRSRPRRPARSTPPPRPLPRRRRESPRRRRRRGRRSHEGAPRAAAAGRGAPTPRRAPDRGRPGRFARIECCMRRNVFSSSSDGPSPARARVERRLDGILDRDEVVAVDDRSAHPVALGPGGDVLDRALRAPVGGERELVVLADEDDRELPGRGEVHPLMGRALAGGPVPEEGDHGPPASPQRRGEPGPAGVRDACADDAVAAEDVEREVGDVHRATEALAVARALAEHLRHHPAQVGTGRDQVPVRAVVADEVVPFAHHAGRPDRDRLLADAAVRRAEDDALFEELLGAILEGADQPHPPVLLDERRPPGGTLRRDNRVSRHGRPLVELEDVAVRIERVEALASPVRTRPSSRPAPADEPDASCREIVVQRLDVATKTQKCPVPWSRRRVAARASSTPRYSSSSTSSRCRGCAAWRCRGGGLRDADDLGDRGSSRAPATASSSPSRPQ